ncbi:MAG TPA: hypothetical protein VKR24_03320, partial [Candidatus Limnocylindrales bacterium]|nr:hypothetical protein [Candidatus Limnocylindrales bacterium]
MTTATFQSPPTAAEIRAWVVDQGTYPKPHSLRTQLVELVEDWSNAINAGAFDALEAEDPRDPEHPIPGSWNDLRPSEAVILRDLVKAAAARALDRCEAIIVDELTAAGVTFAE